MMKNFFLKKGSAYKIETLISRLKLYYGYLPQNNRCAVQTQLRSSQLALENPPTTSTASSF